MTDFPVVIRSMLGLNLEFCSVAVLFEGENDGQQVKRAKLKRSTAFNSIYYAAVGGNRSSSPRH